MDSTFSNLLSSPSSISLPSRKRDLEAAEGLMLDGQNKSRRATPTPGARPSSTPLRLEGQFDNPDHMDIIDLTGYV
jgi:hypothetical protein